MNAPRHTPISDARPAGGLALVQLLHLADSALPTGGYAFSHGLESSAKLGLIRTMEDLEAFMVAALRQLIAGDLPFLISAHRLWASVRAGDAECTESEAELRQLFRQVDAWILTASMRRASLTQGRSWLVLSRRLWPTAAIEDVATWLDRQAVPMHLPPVLGLCLSALGASESDATQLYLYMAARDYVSAAIRLGLFGPQDGHAMLARLGAVDRLMRPGFVPHWTAARRVAPLLDLAQARHHEVYAKLFQN